MSKIWMLEDEECVNRFKALRDAAQARMPRGAVLSPVAATCLMGGHSGGGSLDNHDLEPFRGRTIVILAACHNDWIGQDSCHDSAVLLAHRLATHYECSVTVKVTPATQDNARYSFEDYMGAIQEEDPVRAFQQMCRWVSWDIPVASIHHPVGKRGVA